MTQDSVFGTDPMASVHVSSSGANRGPSGPCRYHTLYEGWQRFPGVPRIYHPWRGSKVVLFVPREQVYTENAVRWNQYLPRGGILCEDTKMLQSLFGLIASSAGLYTANIPAIEGGYMRTTVTIHAVPPQGHISPSDAELFNRIIEDDAKRLAFHQSDEYLDAVERTRLPPGKEVGWIFHLSTGHHHNEDDDLPPEDVKKPQQTEYRKRKLLERRSLRDPGFVVSHMIAEVEAKERAKMNSLLGKRVYEQAKTAGKNPYCSALSRSTLTSLLIRYRATMEGVDPFEARDLSWFSPDNPLHICHVLNLETALTKAGRVGGDKYFCDPTSWNKRQTIDEASEWAISPFPYYGLYANCMEPAEVSNDLKDGLMAFYFPTHERPNGYLMDPTNNIMAKMLYDSKEHSADDQPELECPINATDIQRQAFEFKKRQAKHLKEMARLEAIRKAHALAYTTPLSASTPQTPKALGVIYKQMYKSRMQAAKKAPNLTKKQRARLKSDTRRACQLEAVDMLERIFTQNNMDLPDSGRGIAAWVQDFLPRNGGTMCMENSAFTSNMSSFSEEMIYLSFGLDALKYAHSVHPLCVCLILGCMHIYMQGVTMQLNQLVLGEQSAGKSFALVNLIAKLLIAGTCQLKQSESEKADHVSHNNDRTDVIEIWEEMPPSYLGISDTGRAPGNSGSAKDSAGNNIASIIRGRQTSLKVSYTRLEKQPDGSYADTKVEYDANKLTLAAANAVMGDIPKNHLSRWLAHILTKYRRLENSFLATIRRRTPEYLEAAKELFTLRFRRNQVIFWWVAKLQFMDAFAQTNIDESDQFLTTIMDRFGMGGMDISEEVRPKTMVSMMLDCIIKWDAFCKFFDSPLSPVRRLSGWKWRWLVDYNLEDWLRGRVEHVVFALGLVRAQWLNPFQNSIFVAFYEQYVTPNVQYTLRFKAEMRKFKIKHKPRGETPDGPMPRDWYEAKEMSGRSKSDGKHAGKNGHGKGKAGAPASSATGPDTGGITGFLKDPMHPPQQSATVAAATDPVHGQKPAKGTAKAAKAANAIAAAVQGALNVQQQEQQSPPHAGAAPEKKHVHFADDNVAEDDDMMMNIDENAAIAENQNKKQLAAQQSAMADYFEPDVPMPAASSSFSSSSSSSRPASAPVQQQRQQQPLSEPGFAWADKRLVELGFLEIAFPATRMNETDGDRVSRLVDSIYNKQMREGKPLRGELTSFFRNLLTRKIRTGGQEESALIFDRGFMWIYGKLVFTTDAYPMWTAISSLLKKQHMPRQEFLTGLPVNGNPHVWEVRTVDYSDDVKRDDKGNNDEGEADKDADEEDTEMTIVNPSYVDPAIGAILARSSAQTAEGAKSIAECAVTKAVPFQMIVDQPLEEHALQNQLAQAYRSDQQMCFAYGHLIRYLMRCQRHRSIKRGSEPFPFLPPCDSPLLRQKNVPEDVMAAYVEQLLLGANADKVVRYLRKYKHLFKYPEDIATFDANKWTTGIKAQKKARSKSISLKTHTSSLRSARLNGSDDEDEDERMDGKQSESEKKNKAVQQGHYALHVVPCDEEGEGWDQQNDMQDDIPSIAGDGKDAKESHSVPARQAPSSPVHSFMKKPVYVSPLKVPGIGSRALLPTQKPGERRILRGAVDSDPSRRAPRVESMNLADRNQAAFGSIYRRYGAEDESQIARDEDAGSDMEDVSGDAEAEAEAAASYENMFPNGGHVTTRAEEKAEEAKRQARRDARRAARTPFPESARQLSLDMEPADDQQQGSSSSSSSSSSTSTSIRRRLVRNSDRNNSQVQPQQQSAPLQLEAPVVDGDNDLQMETEPSNDDIEAAATMMNEDAEMDTGETKQSVPQPQEHAPFSFGRTRTATAATVAVVEEKAEAKTEEKEEGQEAAAEPDLNEIFAPFLDHLWRPTEAKLNILFEHVPYPDLTNDEEDVPGVRVDLQLPSLPLHTSYAKMKNMFPHAALDGLFDDAVNYLSKSIAIHHKLGYHPDRSSTRRYRYSIAHSMFHIRGHPTVVCILNLVGDSAVPDAPPAPSPFQREQQQQQQEQQAAMSPTSDTASSSGSSSLSSFERPASTMFRSASETQILDEDSLLPTSVRMALDLPATPARKRRELHKSSSSHQSDKKRNTESPARTDELSFAALNESIATEKQQQQQKQQQAEVGDEEDILPPPEEEDDAFVLVQSKSNKKKGKQQQQQEEKQEQSTAEEIDSEEEEYLASGDTEDAYVAAGEAEEEEEDDNAVSERARAEDAGSDMEDNSSEKEEEEEEVEAEAEVDDEDDMDATELAEAEAGVDFDSHASAVQRRETIRERGVTLDSNMTPAALEERLQAEEQDGATDEKVEEEKEESMEGDEQSSGSKRTREERDAGTDNEQQQSLQQQPSPKRARVND